MEKTSFLLDVEAYNVAKLEHSWKQGIGCKTTKNLVEIDVKKYMKQVGMKKTGRSKDNSNKREKNSKKCQQRLTDKQNNKQKK